MRGLPWVNGLDTLQTYQDSRVLELVSFESSVQINNWTYSFPSNCNGTMFFRPSTPQVTLQLFLTTVSTGALVPVVPGEWGARLFSISGVEKYRVNNFKMYKEIRSKFINLALKTSSVTMLDSRNRAMLWNLNMRQIMGSAYDDYSVFKLITHSIQPHQGAVNPTANTYHISIVYVLSGLPWSSSSYPYLIGIGNNDIYHKERKSIIGLGALTTQPYREMYIENFIDRPKQYSTLVLTYNDVYGNPLISASAGVTLFTNHVIQFTIIPVE